MQTSPANRIQLSPETLLLMELRRADTLKNQKHYQEALEIYLQVTAAHPEMADVWSVAANACIWLKRWQDAIRYAQTALARGGNSFLIYDVLVYAHRKLDLWNEAGRYGAQALDMRDRQFGGKPVMPPPEPAPLPPAPSAQTRQRNIIAFSLFGGDSKYCETAVLNAREQPRIYPHWVCRFYVDGSVPERVLDRLRAGGAQVVLVEGAAAQWPGPMWRFLALDDPQAHRILFRDADSLISPREAGAVRQWIASGKRFHMMRDDVGHVELIMAGLWGAVAGSLPPLDKLIQRFLAAPLESRPDVSGLPEFRHYADQFFLREYVWPYARQSLMQHDSVFGFRAAAPFPDAEKPKGFHVGCVNSARKFIIKSDLPDESEVVWDLYRIEKLDSGSHGKAPICAYPGVVKDGAVQAHIPARYVQWIEQGAARVDLRASGAAS
jgi:hypothetical protein